ncbi:hypothetical protein HN51_023734 [Arachis hypogaea]|nr:uncharacterized protein LOC112703892 [Arachis hypogaea]QHO26671.1 uncharacterized protein DS421_7g201580 [Arachis hypogaea]
MPAMGTQESTTHYGVIEEGDTFSHGYCFTFESLFSSCINFRAPPPSPSIIYRNPLRFLSSTTKSSLNPPPPPQYVSLAPTTTTLQSPNHNSTNTCLSSSFMMTSKNHVKSTALLESTVTQKPTASATSLPTLSNVAVKKGGGGAQ